jgi:hypothetical protein
MNIVAHIPFFGPNLEKFKILRKTIKSLKTLSKNVEIFVHTHNNFLNNKKISSKIIIHKLSAEDLNKGYLTWKCRELLERQKNKFDIFIYCEHDIFFTKKNFKYWLQHKDELIKKNFNLGFLTTEFNYSDNKFYSIHLQKKLTNYINIKNKKYMINPQPYCCMWIYDRIEFNSFIKTKWWKFKWNGKNYLCFYGVTEMSGIGWNGMNMDRYKSSAIHVNNNNKLNSGCFIRHLTNNYIHLKGKIFNNPKTWCKYDIQKVVDNINRHLPFKEIYILEKLLLIFKYSFRKILRIINRII